MQRADYFNNVEGLNLTDSPLFVKDGQSTGGYNYEYSHTGGFSKISGLAKINTVADTQLNTLGLHIHETSTGTKTNIRCAGTKIQTVNLDTPAFTNLTDDTVSASTSFLTSGSTQPVVSAQFNTSDANLLFMAGGGMTTPVAYNGTTVTTLGVAAPTGTLTAVNQGTGTGGAWTPTSGSYYWAIALRKRSTQAISNAALDKTATIATATDSVLLTFPTGIDTTKYDKWYVYRSSVSGSTAFTAGMLVAKVDTTLATYTDTGSSLATSQNVPRAGNVLLDNSTLPSGTYNTISVFKRRLVATSNDTIYISDLDKPESFPIGLVFPIHTGGPITAQTIIGYISPTQGSTDEYAMFFKARECWAIEGTGVYDSTLGIYDFALKFIDSVGCIAQPLVVRVNGFVTWIDYRGVYMWSGNGKPMYVSRPVEALFSEDGDLDKTNLSKGFGVYSRKKSVVVWTLSHRTKGTNKVQLKLDLRLTVPRTSDVLSDNNVIEGVFAMDSYATALYSGVSYLPSTPSEIFLVADNAGYLYKMYYSASDNGSGIQFNYLTKALDQGLPTVAKQYSKVVIYIAQSVSKDLTLNYWTDYRVLTNERSTNTQPMEPPNNTLRSSLWDLALWDESLWDEYNTKIIPLTFNLSDGEGNNQGDSIMLGFSQTDTTAPVTIYGFSIYWDVLGPRNTG